MKYIFACLFSFLGIAILVWGDKVYGESSLAKCLTEKKVKKFFIFWKVVVKNAVGIGLIIMAVMVLFK